MRKLKIPASWSKFIGKCKMIWAKHGPMIKFVTGNVGLVGAGVAGCVATAKAMRILDSAKDTIAAIKDIGPECSYHMEDPKTGELVECTQTEAIAMVRKETAVKLFKLYIIPVGVGASAVIIETSGFKDMLVRNAALSASLTAYKKALDTYKERAQRYLTPEEQLSVKYGDDVIGEIKEDEAIEQILPNTYSPLAIVFDETCIGWTGNIAQDLWFIRTREREANEIFNQQGFFFLNDAYKMLGVPMKPKVIDSSNNKMPDRRDIGQVLGWDKNNPNGDGYISFGIDEHMDNPETRAFVNGRYKYIVLDFNVDGYILDSLKLNPKTCDWMPKV